MEADRIHTDMDSDILNIHVPVLSLFPSPRMQADQIHMDSDILDIHFSVSFLFPSLIGCGMWVVFHSEQNLYL